MALARPAAAPAESLIPPAESLIPFFLDIFGNPKIIKKSTPKNNSFFAFFAIFGSLVANSEPLLGHFGVPVGYFLRFFRKLKKLLIPDNVITF